jgi:zinc transport system permease protein
MIEALQHDYVRNALAAGLLASIACGVIGAYVVVKKIVFMGGGISHASFGGIGIGHFLGINPLWGAFFYTLASAISMGVATRRTKLPPDTAIGVLWALGMALGVIFLDLTPGYTPQASSYLFGDIGITSLSDIMLMVALDIVIIFTVFLLYKEFLILSFDEEFGESVGAPMERSYLVLLSLIALSVVVLIRVVGIILVIALLTLPVAAGRQFTHSLKRLMLFSTLLGLISTTLGIGLWYEFDLASGPAIVVVSTSLFVLSLLFSQLRHRRIR